jgi:hypothetical protein
VFGVRWKGRRFLPPNHRYLDLCGEFTFTKPQYSFGLPSPASTKMATLADELLNDFEDSGSDDGNRQNDFLGDEDQEQPNGLDLKNKTNDVQTKMELDGDEEDVEDAEEELAPQNGTRDLDDVPDEEETKAKVEKLKLGGVADVRSVAVLMKTLQPVLEVIISLLSPALSQMSCAFTSLVKQT